MKAILDVCNKLSIGSQQSLHIPFIGEGNVWINNTYDISAIRLAQSIIYEAICKTAPGQLSIIGYDSDLSGVFAPFAALSSGEYKLLDLIVDKKELKSYVGYIWQQIQATQNVIQGRQDSLIKFRKAVGKAVEGYTLVVLSMDMGIIDNELRSELATLMRSGPAAGISFLIISTTFMSFETATGKEVVLTVQALSPNITVLEASNNSVCLENGSNKVSWTMQSPEKIIHECEMFSERIKHAQLPVVPFEELHDIKKTWDRSSVEGLTFSIGKYGINNVEITIGDEINQRHNAVITGAVGQGKSNLISVIIHSLCLHYSPRELVMYLLDYKEGVTFKAFSNIDQDEYLPHARALGLESDVSFGVAILEMLFDEYQRRMRTLKKSNLKSIRDFRKKYPDAEMPRIVVVIDEFQMMFGDDINEGQKIAEKLEKYVRLFRAAGIHFILASQTLGGNMALSYKKDSIFAQIPIRIALKNSLIESQQTLSLNNSAAAFLRPREAIVNLDYGEISQNKKTVIAYADENVVAVIRKKWWETARDQYAAPYVFESEKRISISRGINDLLLARKSDSNPMAIIGEKISVDGAPILIPISNEPGKNIAILGSNDDDCNQAAGMIQSIATSLAVQHVKGDARFIFFDFTNDTTLYEKKYPEFAAIMESIGYFIECYDNVQFEEMINKVLDDASLDETIYIFGIGLDRWQYERDPYGNGSALKKLVENAPAKGIHFIGWWTKSSSFTAQVAGYGSSDSFNTKIFLRIDEKAVQSLTSPFVKWSAQKNRGLVSDSIEFADEIVFVPYAPITQEDINRFKSTIWN